MQYIVYKITNLKNNMWYIGSHEVLDANNWCDDYWGSGSALEGAKNYYGIKNFKREILFVFNNEDEMKQKERELLEQLDAANNKLSYNIINKAGGTNKDRPKRAIRVNGKIRSSILEVAKEEGVSVAAIHSRCSSKCDNGYEFVDEVATQGVRYTDGKDQYSNLFQMARAYNMSINGMRNRLKNPNFPKFKKLTNPEDWIGDVVKVSRREVIFKNTSMHGSKVCIIEGEVFESIRKASIKRKMSMSGIRNRCLSPKYEDWNFAEDAYKRDTSNNKSKICIAYGVKYRNFEEAAIKNGIHPTTALRWCHDPKNKDWIRIDESELEEEESTSASSTDNKLKKAS